MCCYKSGKRIDLPKRQAGRIAMTKHSENLLKRNTILLICIRENIQHKVQERIYVKDALQMASGDKSGYL
jgi:hypothetical protein